MIRLSLLRGPVEVDLSAVYPGVKLTLRRLTSPELAEARDAAISALREARKGLEALAPYGLDGADARGVRLNPLDTLQMVRAGVLVGGVETAIRAIEAWEGITLEDGKPAPIDRSTLSLLLQDDGLQRRIMHEIEQASRILVSEGNGSGPSPIGSSATRPVTEAAPPSVETAGSSATPAPAGESAGTGATASRSSSRRRPSKPPPSGGN